MDDWSATEEHILTLAIVMKLSVQLYLMSLLCQRAWSSGHPSVRAGARGRGARVAQLHRIDDQAVERLGVRAQQDGQHARQRAQPAQSMRTRLWRHGVMILMEDG